MRRSWRRTWPAFVLLLAAPLAAQTAPTAAPPTIALSQNPLRSGSVTFRWAAAGSGPARVIVYSLLGTPVASAVMLPDSGAWTWDGSVGGAPAANGAYIVTVTRGDGKRMRHRLIVAH